MSDAPLAFRRPAITALRSAAQDFLQRCADRGSSIRDVDNMRLAYAAGLYAASFAMLSSKANAQDISEAAQLVEEKR